MFENMKMFIAEIIARIFGLQEPCPCMGAAVVNFTLLAFGIYLFRLFIEGPAYTRKNRIDGKVAIITGCNTGIGKETALELARRGARVYMACRDAKRCEAARLEIIASTKNEHIYNRSLDLASLKSVRQFVADFLKEENRLDILVNNAGVLKTAQKLTEDGFESKIGVNHLGHFLLTNLLLERLEQSAPSRIVVVTSIGYIMGRINKEDLQSQRKYSELGSYSQSKLANILFTRKLAEKLKGTNITVNCCHPGVIRTELYRDFSLNRWPGADYISSWFMKSIKAGAQTTIRLALDPVLEKESGGFYADCMHFPVLPHASNKQMADWLWQESEKLVGLK